VVVLANANNEALISSKKAPAGQSVTMDSTNLVRLVRLACSRGHADGGFTYAIVSLFVSSWCELMPKRSFILLFFNCFSDLYFI